MTDIFNSNVQIYRQNQGIPLEVFGQDATHGGTIVYCKHYNDDGSSSPEFTGFRARGTIANPTDAQAGDELLKIAAVGQSGGIAQQAGYMQFRAAPGWGGGSPNDAPCEIEFAVAPDNSDVPQNAMIIRSDRTVDIEGSLRIKNNTMLWGEDSNGNPLGLIYMSPNNETTLQLNNNRHKLSDANVVTDANGKITGIRYVVNNKTGVVPFTED